MPITVQSRGEHLLTNSRRNAYMTCPRKHYLAYEFGLRPTEDAPPLRDGSCVHFALDLWKKGSSTGAAIAEALSAFLSESDYDFSRIAALLEGYWWRWQESNLRIIASESRFELPLTNPGTGASARIFTLAGKIDAVVELPDKRLAVMEHKTTSEDIAPDSDYWKALRIDGQISLYMLAARSLGFNVSTVIYDVLHKPLLRPLQIPVLDSDGNKIVTDGLGERILNANGKPRQTGDKERGYVLQTRIQEPDEYKARLLEDIYAKPDEYYARREIARIDSDLADARRDLWETARLIRESQLNNYWPRNTAACRAIGRKCPYFHLCVDGYDPATGEVPEYFELVDDLHPELGD